MASGRETWHDPELAVSSGTISAHDLAHEVVAAPSAGTAAYTPSPATLRPPARLRTLPARPLAVRGRPKVAGKFLQVGGAKRWVRGVAYGTFRPSSEGLLLPERELVARDFAAMAVLGINAVRVYTLPPRWLLDLAAGTGIRVLVGFDWPVHVAFLESRQQARKIERLVREGARSLAGHEAILAWSLGNEIPGPVVRWHGRRRIERFLERLFEEVKAQDPGGLVSYVSYPTTEYLELPFLDFAAFNVYLESRERLAAYLARLQNLAGERPLLMTELGLDSRQHGEQRQAEVLDWQLRELFEAACAGAFVFSWTADWYVGGREIFDWDFGLTTRTREPKPALGVVQRAYAQLPARRLRRWPRISIVVCSYNGSRTIRDTLEGLDRLDYPDYEVIVVDDGSTDATPEIARSHDVKLISTPNQGLAAARNVGLAAASGEIVAYLDDDAYPDPDWLTYLAIGFTDSEVCGVGGPNLLPPEDGDVAECVANAPGGPAHVLVGDREAEHIPGCNMAFRKDWLLAVGGFDPQFRCAGDDVDLCWNVQRIGGRIGFHAGALVWHHRRGSIARYWKQQLGYGKAEALLARKWPGKYNSAGHVPWSGRIYGRGLTRPVLGKPQRIYHGVWGSAPFQSVYQPAQGALGALPLLPEWYLLIAGLAGLAGLGVAWAPLRVAAIGLVLALAAVVLQAANSAARAQLRDVPRSRLSRWKMRGLIFVLHLLQPAARLYGRLRHGLAPWKPRAAARWTLPRPRQRTIWSERWRPHTAWLEALETVLRESRALVRRGAEWDRFELAVHGGPCGAARVRLAVEEHGEGRQYLRFRIWPKLRRGLVASLLGAALAGAALADQAWLAGSVLVGCALALPLAALRECGRAQGELERALQQLAAAARVDGDAAASGSSGEER
jgi:GT2 family glycosyltransferase